MSAKNRQLLFRVLIGASLGACVLTLVPWPPSAVANDLGYKSLCPFAPWSSLAMLGLAGLLAATQSYISSQLD